MRSEKLSSVFCNKSALLVAIITTSIFNYSLQTNHHASFNYSILSTHFCLQQKLDSLPLRPLNKVRTTFLMLQLICLLKSCASLASLDSLCCFASPAALCRRYARLELFVLGKQLLARYKIGREPSKKHAHKFRHFKLVAFVWIKKTFMILAGIESTQGAPTKLKLHTSS